MTHFWLWLGVGIVSGGSLGAAIGMWLDHKQSLKENDNA